jgi:hypothetical protein
VLLIIIDSVLDIYLRIALVLCGMGEWTAIDIGMEYV